MIFKHFKERKRKWHLRYLIIKGLYDSETHLLLTGPISFMKLWWASKKLHVGFSLNVARLATWAKNCFYFDCWQCAVHTGHADPTGQRHSKTRQYRPLRFFFLQKSLVELQSYCQTLPKHGRTVLQFSCFKDKSANYSRLVGSKWMSQCCGDILEELYR